eukprot:gb/GECG01001122.1/.p1 GENE.gb/GECG01001122.1/~~gb/GECG01001122.1/.p1  ORF type:complete len:204 (+),score=26.68 gb/GECG01001122.1/:1-612(+)
MPPYFGGSSPGGRGGGGRGGRGGGRGGFRGGRGGSRGGGGRGGFDGPPDYVVEMGYFMHTCEGDMVCKSTNEKVPYFNAPIFLHNKTQIGKVDEILSQISNVMFTVKCSEGVVASSFKEEDKVYISPEKLLPLSRFLPKPKGTPSGAGRGRGGARGGGRGAPRGRGGGGRGGGRGAPRGGGRGAPRGRGGGFRGGSRGRGRGF